MLKKIYLLSLISLHLYTLAEFKNSYLDSENYYDYDIDDTNCKRLGFSLCDSGYSKGQLFDSSVTLEQDHQSSMDDVVLIDTLKFVSVYDLIKQNTSLMYQVAKPALPFSYEPFSLSIFPKDQPNVGEFDETFVLTIPNGRVCSGSGWVIVNNCFMTEFIWKRKQLGLLGLNTTKFENIKKVPGRVAVIAQRGASCYFHWVSEVLGRLAMLEMQGVAYDYVYVACDKPFMKESLILWGIDPAKIIDASLLDNHYIQADELILPSLVSKIKAGYTRFCSYVPEYILRYVQEKLVIGAQNKNISFDHKKRVFISRKDSKVRQMTNEDEVFALFEAKGFERYDLSSLSVQEQIMLFQNAEIVVGCHGAGITNILYCKPETLIIELFQARGSATYCYISQMLGLKYWGVKTMEFSEIKNGFFDTEVPLPIIEEVVSNL